MPDIHIVRPHAFGLKRAREVAWQWAEDVEQKLAMECTVEEGDTEDLVHFVRSGVKGTLRITADTFELDAKLGLLLGAFKGQIESEIEKNLDAILAKGAAKPAKKAVTKKAAAKTTALKKR
ncbi:MAG TPA: polyhydroxyalkanoic acid system family protein [Methylibium sp.]|uniref:polyhydroxyalkanoic acid system family protein n=1 Tax=Methylibium sp. TaxID=2067992 RepID=UPI002DBA118B|nr:polyhydroxyalkanoic acid system family protein [Methylibium sp.]HEU4458925.1 polyhydroxyalkanoic acid system family protein [Methylibium sp.]